MAAAPTRSVGVVERARGSTGPGAAGLMLRLTLASIGVPSTPIVQSSSVASGRVPVRRGVGRPIPFRRVAGIEAAFEEAACFCWPSLPTRRGLRRIPGFPGHQMPLAPRIVCASGWPGRSRAVRCLGCCHALDSTGGRKRVQQLRTPHVGACLPFVANARGTAMDGPGSRGRAEASNPARVQPRAADPLQASGRPLTPAAWHCRRVLQPQDHPITECGPAPAHAAGPGPAC